MRVKEESEKDGLTLNIKKTKIMASSPILAWPIKLDANEKIQVDAKTLVGHTIVQSSFKCS